MNISNTYKLSRAVAPIFFFLWLSAAGWCADTDRWLFPRNAARGYVEFQIAPPHNEIDMGVCVLTESSCAGFARYAWGGYLELQPFGRTALQRLFFFIEPKAYGGDNVPQTRYTASPSLILWERNIGAGVMLPRGFELRLTNHRVNLFGPYEHPQAEEIIRRDGPYGLYTTVGMRWYFGSLGRATH